MNKNLTFFSYDFPPLEGGISRLCNEVVHQFEMNNWNVRVISVKCNIDHKTIDEKYKIERVINKRGFRELHSLWKLLFSKKKSLIITGVWYPEALLTTIMGFKNVIVFAHGNDVMTGKSSIKNRVLSFLRKRILTKSKLVICDSRYTQNLVKQQAPKSNTKVCLLGVDEKRFSPIKNNKNIRESLGLPINKKIILTVSRINKYKAHDLIINALSMLSEEDRSKICYCIAGQGNYLNNLKALALSLKVNNCIKWFGFVDEEKLPDLYRASDLFVLCTREEKEDKSVEGFGLVFLEAQACGIPVIGSNQGGIPDAINNGNGGWLIERDDTKTLSGYLIKLVNNDNMFKIEGQKARNRIDKEATWKHFADRVFKEIGKL